MDWLNTYKHLVAAFKLLWLLTVAPKMLKEEHIQALKDWMFKLEDIGKKVEGPGDSQIWSHIR